MRWKTNSQPPKSSFIYEQRNGYVRFIQNRDYDSNDHITYIPYTKSLEIVNETDILIDKYGDAGKVRYGISGAFNVALAKIEPINELYLEYIRSFFEDDSIYNFLHASCLASTRASLNENNIMILNILIPDDQTIINFNNYVIPIRKKILENNKETLKLKQLRDMLLPLLMNGQATIIE